MTTDNVPMQDPKEQPLVAEEVVKPKRTRRAKTAEEAAPSDVAVSAVTAESDSAPAAKKAPARRKKATAEAEVASVATGSDAVAQPEAASAPDEAVVEAPAKPKRASRKKAAEPAAQLDAEAQPDASGAAREEAPHGFFQLAPESAASAESPVSPAAVVPAEPQARAEGEASAAGEPREGREDRGNRRDRGDRGDRGDRQRGPRGDRPPRQDRPEQRQGQSAEGAEGGPGGQGGARQGDNGEEDGADQRPSRRAAIAAEQATEVFAELLSGDFDKVHEESATEETASEEGGAYKRVLRPEPDAPKLQKVLAQAGVGSRRDIEQMIEDGRIEVNDQVAHIGQRISFGDRIKVAGRPIKVRISPPPARILAYHKPVGEVVTHDDPQGRPTVFQRLPRLQNGKWMSVGRLDLNTEGLLLFTNSGELANQLMHPRFGVEREYAVRVLGSLEDSARQKLLAGVEIEGQTASFLSISTSSGEGVNQWYRVVITEGRNREVRKLFDAVGLTVNRLIRVRYGAIVLPRGLRRGVWVELNESDVRAVKSLAGMDRQEFGQGQQGRGGKGQQKGQQGFKGGKPQQQGRGGQQGGGQPYPQGGRPPHGGQGGGQGGQGGYGQNKPRNPMQDRPQQPRHDHDDDGDHIGPIPNPLEQTFDKRFVKGSKRITSGFGRPDQDHGQGGQGGGKQKGPRQPDPMQTSVGYIGADAYFGKTGGGGRRGGGGGGGRGRR